MVEKDKLIIWQQNINKSPTCQHNLLSNNKLTHMGIDIVALQEPAINAFNLTTASRNWTPVYPTTHSNAPDKTRSITLISSQISTDNWNQLDFPSGDVTVTQFTGAWGKLTLFNIYNEGNSSTTINMLTKFHKDNNTIIGMEEHTSVHLIWLGDFNRHHPYWDDPNDDRLFTREVIGAAETLIKAVAEAGLELALPASLPTHVHNVTKRWSRLDQVFVSEHSVNMVTSCNTRADLRGINTDHLPILMELNLDIGTNEAEPHLNFRDIDWDDFAKELGKRLSALEPVTQIITQRHLDHCCNDLTKAIQGTIEEMVPSTDPTPKSKRWWTKELTQLRSHANKLGRLSYARRDMPEHMIYTVHKEAAKRYDKVLQYTKKQHWRDWLERVDEPDIWAMHRLTAAPPSDGGKARIPILKYSIKDQDMLARTNEEKSNALSKGFFPPRPVGDSIPPNFPYPNQCDPGCMITAEQIQRQLRKLKPYKAPGPNGIPNIVLTKCAHLLTSRLFHIYEAMYECQLFYKPWKRFTTVVLRKPGKPRYDVLKAYRPIALLNTMWKVLTAIVADHLIFVTEKHHLLPANHFGGRPGHTTTDAMHLLSHVIKASWRKGKVTSVLFLDIEGAFPNAMPNRLRHNLQKRCVPVKLVTFVHNMLRNRVTTLRFDGYMSEPISIDNGIGQGDPLSMGLYQYYNADLLKIPNKKDEEAIAYVDDGIMLAMATTFTKAHDMLADMMTREGGVAEWSHSHNSLLEYSKLALIDFAHSCKPAERTPLHLPRGVVHLVKSAKYLGVIFDQHLDWKAQHAQVAAKGTKWALQIKRLAKPSWGISPNFARKLYISVAIPKALYAVDVWSNPTRATLSDRKCTAKAAKQLTTLQRAGTIAITGGLRTSPTDTLDATAYLMPAVLTTDKWCHRSLVRLTMLPTEHPLHKALASKLTRKTKRHKSPLSRLLQLYGYDLGRIEKFPSAARNPEQTGKLPFNIIIPESREDSAREVDEAIKDIQVFTDGLALDGKVGAAVILTRSGKPPRSLHLHLRPESEHTVHEAELVGILLGLHLISKEKHGSTSCMLGVDNQAAIRAFHSDLRKPGHHIAREIILLANRVQKHRRKVAYSLTICWTAGHEGIAGNKAADKEAKKAAEGKTSEKHLLPPYLRKPLLTNPAAIKRTFHDKLKTKWFEDWRNSQRGQRVVAIDKTTPSKKFLLAISQNELSR